MFYLHDQTRRFLTQLFFIFLGPILFFSVLGYALWVRTTDYRKDYAATLSQVTGKEVKIGKIRFPKPFLTKISDLVISEPETGEILVIIPRCEIAGSRSPLENNNKAPIFRGLFSFFSKRHRLEQQADQNHVVSVPFLATHRGAVSYIKTELLSNISKPFHCNEIQFHINEVDVFSTPFPEDWRNTNFFHLEKNQANSLTNLSVKYSPGKKRTEMVLSFQNRNQSVPAGPEFRVIRQHDPSGQMLYRFTTGQTSLATDFLSLFSPFFDRYGNRCKFQGEFHAACQGNLFHKTEIHYDLKNSLFSQVDIQNILSDYVGFTIQGELEQLWIKSASFSNGSMNMMEGAVENGSGIVQRKGLIRIVKRLGLLMQPEMHDQGGDKPIEFGNCSFRFSFSPLGVVFDTVGSRSLLTLAGSHELQKPQRRIDYPELLASLSTANVATVPMTEQARALLRILPENHPTDLNPVPNFSQENNLNPPKPEPAVATHPGQANPWNRH